MGSIERFQVDRPREGKEFGPMDPNDVVEVKPNLVEWLTACISDVEQAAIDAKRIIEAHTASFSTEAAWKNQADSERLLDHIMLHGPAIVLREVARNRRILERHEPSIIDYRHGRQDVEVCSYCEQDEQSVEWPCDEVRDLTSVFADRPGFQKEWGSQ